MKRRSFVKWAAAFPLLAQVGLEQALGTGWAEVVATPLTISIPGSG